MLKKFKRFVKVWAFKFFNYLFMIFPLNSHKIVFLSDQRASLGGNLEFLYNFISDDEYKKILILKKDRFHGRSFVDKFRLVYHFSTAKYILLDDWSRAISIMKRRKKQEIVQLWHGPGAFKTFGYSRLDKTEIAKKDKYSMHRNYTKAIVTSDEIRWCYAEGFGMNIENIKAVGFPRTDVLFDEKYKEKIKDSFYKDYPELKGKKIVLFAPTYRGENLRKASYDFEFLSLKKLQKSLGEDYAFILKWHPAVYNNLEAGKIFFDYSRYQKFCYDFSNLRDINDLLIVADILITDYSSVIFDYYLLDKPIIYYVYDLETYNENRGLYYDFQDYVYGDVATNMDELIRKIKSPSMDEEKRKVFNQKFMNACDGHSTEKTYQYIFEEK